MNCIHRMVARSAGDDGRINMAYPEAWRSQVRAYFAVVLGAKPTRWEWRLVPSRTPPYNLTRDCIELTGEAE